MTCLIASLAKLAVSNGSFRSLRCSLVSRRLRRIRRNECGEALAPYSRVSSAPPAIGGANIADADRALMAAAFLTRSQPVMASKPDC
jgi:hypothetical protein